MNIKKALALIGSGLSLKDKIQRLEIKEIKRALQESYFSQLNLSLGDDRHSMPGSDTHILLHLGVHYPCPPCCVYDIQNTKNLCNK